jgi:hypothetical protein
MIVNRRTKPIIRDKTGQGEIGIYFLVVSVWKKQFSFLYKETGEFLDHCSVEVNVIMGGTDANPRP